MSRKDKDNAASGGRIAAHILAFVGVTLLAAVILLAAAGLMLKFGPSPAAGERFAELAAERGAPEFVTELFAARTDAPAASDAPAESEGPAETAEVTE